MNNYFRENRVQGRYLMFQVNSTYGEYGGLQFIGLTGLNSHSPGYNPGYERKYYVIRLMLLILIFSRKRM